MTTKRIPHGPLALLGVVVLLAAACGSSSTKAASTGTTASGASDSPGASFSVAKVSGLGSAVVDGRGRTVYILTADGKTSLPCEDSTGCTKAWPDVSLPDGVSAAKAGAGIDASLLGTKKVGDETYPTYHGWLLYEFAGDSGPGQGHGEGIKSFGGTWYALDAKGAPITSESTGTSAPATGGY